MAEISHPDVSKMEALVAAINEGKFCNYAIPTPKELTETVAGFPGEDKREAHEAQQKANLEKYGHADWYSFQTSNWGTKWDVDPYDTVTLDGNGIQFGFDSAWSPPTGVYEALVEQGFNVKAYYWESGMCFAGVWNNGDDDYYELGGMSSKQVAEEIDPELDEVMCISETIANYEEEEEENENE
jgi:hypothetical protein